jgi:hypothetical protein
MTEPADKTAPENEPPEVLAHDSQHEEGPCNGNAQCGVHQAEQQ